MRTGSAIVTSSKEVPLHLPAAIGSGITVARKRWKVFGNDSNQHKSCTNLNYSYYNFKLKSTFENIVSRWKSQYLDLKHKLNPKIKYIDSNDYSHFDYAVK